MDSLHLQITFNSRGRSLGFSPRSFLYRFFAVAFLLAGFLNLNAEAQQPVQFPSSVFELPNLPYEIPATSFTEEYKNKYQGKLVFETHEVVELGTILTVLSLKKEGKSTGNWYVDTDYFRQVEEHFADHLEHPIFAELAKLNLTAGDYQGLRESGFAYRFAENKLVASDVFANWWPEAQTGLKDRIKEFLPLIEDFASAAQYRQFYAANGDDYRKLADEMAQLIPMSDARAWLEREFPLVSYDSIRVIFSPLTRGSHSGNAKFSAEFNQNITMNAGPEYVREYEHPIDRSVVMTRQVFTEIDHNYADLAMIFFIKDVLDGFADTQKWTKNTGGRYGSPPGAFSEYMTWSAFLLFAREHWDEEVFLREKTRVIKLMENDRKFYRFQAFYEKLEKLYDSKQENLTLAHLIPAIAEWAKTVQLD